MRRITFLITMFFTYLFGMFLLPVALVLGLFDKKLQVQIAYAFNRFIAILSIKISGAKLEMKGLDHIPKNQAVLYVGNHRSMFDILLLMKLIRTPLIFVGKKSVMKWPVISWWMRAQKTLFIDRDNLREGLKVIIKGIELLKDGDSIVIFPEGTRSKTDEMLPFKKGSFKLATKSGVPVIPFAIKGTDDVFENNKFNLKPKTIYITVGKPILLSEVEDTNKDNHTQFIRGIIENMYNEIHNQN
ncbi:MAG: 1-acyl-sn-glycerol-3-phosphate acyltransferase [Firmicutes bacterium HGW-Firmicutes-1]|nr:MAG: 1-acyl-sn-glycerol-3-phosphate acyltransferase [Firmicutes bacterium HGW-Firmicutes-1]